VFELSVRVKGLNPPTVFSPPYNTLSNYVQGVSYIGPLLYAYNLHHNFVQSPTVEKFNPI